MSVLLTIIEVKYNNLKNTLKLIKTISVFSIFILLSQTKC